MKTKHLMGAFALILALSILAVPASTSDDQQSDIMLAADTTNLFSLTSNGNLVLTGAIWIPDHSPTYIYFDCDLVQSYNHSISVSWGDGKSNSYDEIIGSDTSRVSFGRTYSELGTYSITFSDTITPTDGEATNSVTVTKSISVTLSEDNPAILIEEDESSTYTALFYSNGGTGSVSSQTVQPGASITLPRSGFTRDGYTLTGWLVLSGANSSGNSSYTHYDLGASYTVSRNVIFHAEWTASIYTVTFNSNGGTGTIASQTVEPGVSITLPRSGFTRDGYTLTGWLARSGTTTSGDPYYTYYPLGASYTVSRNATLYAEWTANTYTVTFNSNGGTGTIASQTVQPGVSITLPQSGYTRSGYILAGWNTNSSGTGTNYNIGASYTVNSNVTLYAKWLAESSGDSGAPTTGKVGELYSFTPNMQSSAWAVIVEVSSNTSCTLVYDGPEWLKQTGTFRQPIFTGTPTEAGVYTVTVYATGVYTNLEEMSKVTWNITVSSDVPENYTVNFNSNGGTGSVSSQTVQPNNAITLPSTGIVRSGYTLIGWSEGSTSGPTYNLGSLYTVEETTTFYAKWIANSNLVVFDANGGSGTTQYIAATNDTVTLPSGGFTRSGYVFAGWYLAENSNAIYAPGSTYLVSGQTTMYAYWIANNTSYLTVTYNANGGTGSITSQIIESGKSIVLPTSGFNKSDTVLSSWNTAANASGTNYELGTTVTITNNVTLYAQWEAAESSNVVITFNLNGGTGAIATQNLTSGSTVTKPTNPTRDGYIFREWRVLGGAAWDFSTPATASMTLMAYWTQHYTISINGSTVTLEMGSNYSGIPQNIAWGDGETSEGEDSTFTHEYTSITSGRITVTSTVNNLPVVSSMSFSLSGTSPVMHTVIFMDGTTVLNSTTITTGTTLTKPTDPVKEGYVFAGWYTDAEFKTQYTFDSAVTSDLTIYAKWDNGVSGSTILLSLVAFLIIAIFCLFVPGVLTFILLAISTVIYVALIFYWTGVL